MGCSLSMPISQVVWRKPWR